MKHVRFDARLVNPDLSNVCLGKSGSPDGKVTKLTIFPNAYAARRVFAEFANGDVCLFSNEGTRELGVGPHLHIIVEEDTAVVLVLESKITGIRTIITKQEYDAANASWKALADVVGSYSINLYP